MFVRPLCVAQHFSCVVRCVQTSRGFCEQFPLLCSPLEQMQCLASKNQPLSTCALSCHRDVGRLHNINRKRKIVQFRRWGSLASPTSNTYRTATLSLQWQIQGGSRNSLFVVLRACVAGLVCAHERSRKRSGQRNPPFQNPRSATALSLSLHQVAPS